VSRRRRAVQRLPDWEQRLHAYLEAAFDRPHDYGTHDCLLHAAADVLAVTGVDHAKKHRGKYKSQATAVRHLKGLGFDSPEALLDALLEEKPIGFAQRGDLVLVPGNVLPGVSAAWTLPAVVYGSDARVVGTDGEREGLHRVPRTQWLKAYAVGSAA